GCRDRRNPEELDDSARALTNERQRDEGHGEVLEDEREDGRSVERQDGRRDRRLVRHFRARRRRNDVWRNRDRLLPGGERVLLALARRLLDDLRVHLAREPRGEDTGIRLLDRVRDVDVD